MSGRRGPRPTGDRLRRLLVMLPWLMEREEATVAEMTERFQLSEQELVKDLELAAMCGLPPYIDEMVDVFIDEGRVYAGVPRLFTKPLRLTSPEGFALLAAGRASMQLPGADADGALGRALDKLASALGDDGVVVEADQPPAGAEIAAAAADNARVAIVYHSVQASEPTEREVTPRVIFLDRGHWYVVADDHRSGEERTFRLDRIEACRRTGVIDPPRQVIVTPGDQWFAASDLPTALLDLAPEARWVAERYPVISSEDSPSTPGGSRVRLAVTNEHWLRTLLLRLGPAAEVIEPQEWRGLGAAAAADVLARYDAGS
jgi:proteasome accessory factor C